MAKVDQEALVKLQELVDDGKIIQIESIGPDGYEITVYSGIGNDHRHFGGKTLIEAIMKVKL